MLVFAFLPSPALAQPKMTQEQAKKLQKPIKGVKQAKPAASAVSDTIVPKPKKKKQKAHAIDTVPHESAEERRMKRECVGKPNAGACLGYAS
jgi:hypothetical protein